MEFIIEYMGEIAGHQAPPSQINIKYWAPPSNFYMSFSHDGGAWYFKFLITGDPHTISPHRTKNYDSVVCIDITQYFLYIQFILFLSISFFFS
jgi:hypothetical protein